MGKGRLEAFSDGVIAIIITIMVLELHPPHGVTVAELKPLIPTFLSYVLSFVYVGIYWNNHHHMLHVVRSVTGPILWANLHLLFWLSLMPFTTAWFAESELSPLPTALYGVNFLMDALAYTLLSVLLIRHEGPDSPLAKATGADFKGKASLACYVVAIPLAFFAPVASVALFVAVAFIWFLPDRRIERTLGMS